MFHIAGLLLLVATGAVAQPATTAITPAQAQQALDVLKDPARRSQFIAVLETLAKTAAKPTPAPTQPPAVPPPAAAAPDSAAAPAALAIPLAPDSLGAQLLVDASSRLSRLSDDFVSTARAVTDFPLLWRFIVQLATDPWSQAMMFNTGWKLVVVMGIGLAAQWAVRRLLRRPLAALGGRVARARRDLGEPDPALEGIAEAEAGQTEKLSSRRPSAMQTLRNLPYVALRLLLGLLPILAFLAAGYALLGAGLGIEPLARLVILAIFHAYALCRVVTTVLRSVSGPGEPRLLAVSDDVAAYALRWVRRIVAVGVFGYTLAEVGLLFGLYHIAHDAFIKLVALVVACLIITVVVQTRASVAQLIQSLPVSAGVVTMLRNRVAAFWHLIAIFYLLALWAVWALDIPDGFSRLLRIVVWTVAIVTIARMLIVWAQNGLERAIEISPEIQQRVPGLESRLAAYHPIVSALLRSVIGFVAMICLAQAWGLDAFDWFGGGALGGRLAAALGTIAVTLVAALAVWEMVNAGIQRHLARLAAEHQYASSARLRTLLPMLRTTLLISILTVVGLMVLSEIGVNIAPLLAGAGVLGLAIGFGSQKLVQDIITGLFLLLENTMQVGDAVSLGGLSGTVENLSVRTIRLRALDGSIHIVPFSAVTTVTNMTRDFGYAVVDIPVGLNEEPDHIAEILRELAAGLRNEDKWRQAIRDELEILGVDRFIDNAWVMRIRLKTTPSQRWAVGRELNRRIKYRFDALGIESPLTSYHVLATHPAPPAEPPASFA